MHDPCASCIVTSSTQMQQEEPPPPRPPLTENMSHDSLDSLLPQEKTGMKVVSAVCFDGG